MNCRILSRLPSARDIIGYENYYLNDTLLQSIPIASSSKIKEADAPYVARLLYQLYCITAISG